MHDIVAEKGAIAPLINRYEGRVQQRRRVDAFHSCNRRDDGLREAIELFALVALQLPRGSGAVEDCDRDGVCEPRKCFVIERRETARGSRRKALHRLGPVYRMRQHCGGSFARISITPSTPW